MSWGVIELTKPLFDYCGAFYTILERFCYQYTSMVSAVRQTKNANLLLLCLADTNNWKCIYAMLKFKSVMMIEETVSMSAEMKVLGNHIDE